MELIKSLVLLFSSIVALATAVVIYRTTKLKHGSNPVLAKTDGPFSLMMEMMGIYGVALLPIGFGVASFALLMLFVSLPTMFKPTATPTNQATATPTNQAVEEATPAVAVDLASLPVEHTTLYHMGEAAAAMVIGRDRDNTLANVAEKAVKAGAYQVALAAAARMNVGSQRNEVLANVALSAASHAQGKVATAAVGVMSKGNDRNDAALRVIAALDAAPGTALVPTPK